MWYPSITPFRSGRLKVGDGHQLHWEMCGNAQGQPALFLHGGPGGGCTANSRRWFDPDRYCIILFDQRGCGRSTPHARLEDNTTGHLIADIETLRVALAVDRWLLFGRSWGAALALAYAEEHPERVTGMVLSSVFTACHSEIDWLYRGGAARLFPEAWARFIEPIIEPGRADPIAAYYRRLTCGDAAVERAAASDWCRWEDAISARPPSQRVGDQQDLRARARIEAHYFSHGAFLDDGQLLDRAGRLAGIPGAIVQGQDDVVTPTVTARALHEAWPGSSLCLVLDAGHESTAPGMMRALIEATDALRGSQD